MAAGDGVVGLPTRWWTTLASELGRNITNNGVGGTDYPTTATSQLADTVYTNRINIYWAGHNNTNVTNDMAAIASMVAHQTGQRRFLILLPTISAGKAANDPTTIAERVAIMAAYPNNYVDVPGMLATHGDGSANDNADIANGYTPRSLRAIADDIHLTATGQAYVKSLVKSVIQAKGW